MNKKKEKKRILMEKYILHHFIWKFKKRYQASLVAFDLFIFPDTQYPVTKCGTFSLESEFHSYDFMLFMLNNCINIFYL